MKGNQMTENNSDKKISLNFINKSPLDRLENNSFKDDSKFWNTQPSNQPLNNQLDKIDTYIESLIDSFVLNKLKRTDIIPLVINSNFSDLPNDIEDITDIYPYLCKQAIHIMDDAFVFDHKCAIERWLFCNTKLKVVSWRRALNDKWEALGLSIAIRANNKEFQELLSKQIQEKISYRRANKEGCESLNAIINLNHYAVLNIDIQEKDNNTNSLSESTALNKVSPLDFDNKKSIE